MVAYHLLAQEGAAWVKPELSVDRPDLRLLDVLAGGALWRILYGSLLSVIPISHSMVRRVWCKVTLRRVDC